MKTLWLAIGISVLATGSAGAQLARTQPQEKLLIVPFPVSDLADTTLSMALADAVRDKVTSANRYRMLVVPKNKICEALGMSGFACTVLEPGQARELARAMGVDAYVTGRIQRVGNSHQVLVRVVDVNRPGYAATFEVNPAAGGTGANGTTVLADTIASLINTVIKAGEHARACMDAREKNNPRGALGSAQRAFQQYPKIAAALKQHYRIGPKGLRFWDIHVEADAEHSGDGEMILNKYAVTPELRAKARRVALVGLEHRHVAMDGIYRRFGTA